MNILTKLNQEFERDKSLYKSEQERFEAALIRNPISTQKAVSYFGAMLGLFPPCAIFSKFIFDSPRNPELGIVFLLVIVNIACTVGGYFSGRILSNTFASVERLSWNKMILAAPFIGILWGIIAGSAGGVFIFVIGAFFGSFIAAIVGGIAFPSFAILHRLLKRGDVIDEKHFFPIALGITSVITALILGM